VEIPIEEKETGGSLHDKLASAGASLCVETLKRLEEKSVIPVPQGEMTTSYAKMLTKELGNIQWKQKNYEIERLIRGLTPWPSAYTDWNGKVMKIWDASVEEGVSSEVPGTVVKVEKEAFYVQTGEGFLKVNELQIPGKKRMDAGAFMRGYQVKEGEKLG
jgi:methionyl-tRNA formyltransferase